MGRTFVGTALYMHVLMAESEVKETNVRLPLAGNTLAIAIRLGK